MCETYTDEADLAVRITVPYEAHDTFETRRAAARGEPPGRAEGRAQRPVPLWQREEVQEVLPPRR